MAEKLGTLHEQVTVPAEIDEAWMITFTKQFSGGEHVATIAVQDWLEQPLNEFGSGYFKLQDQMGNDGWWQTITGKVVDASRTNVPHYHDTDTANVLALIEASLQLPDGSKELLAEGRLVLIRLDRLKSPVIRIERSTRAS